MGGDVVTTDVGSFRDGRDAENRLEVEGTPVVAGEDNEGDMTVWRALVMVAVSGVKKRCSNLGIIFISRRGSESRERSESRSSK